MNVEYKDTPLGKIPSDWELVTVKEITKEHKQGFYTKDGYVDEGIRLARITDLNNPKVDYSDMPKLNISDSDYQSYKIKKGDFLFARSGAIGRYGIVENDEFPAVFASYLIRFRFNNDIVNRFFGYFFESYLCGNQLKAITQGNANININAENIKSLKFPYAPLPEQEKIAQILSTVDDKIEVIDQQITETQVLKKGLMQRLLTKGIGHTEFKNSPLGEIPKSWEVVRSSDVFELIHGYQFRDYDFTENGLPIVKIGQINRNGEIDMNGCSFFSLDRAEDFVDKRIFNGDVLMALTGATLGKSCWVAGLDNPVYQNYRVGKFVPHDENVLSKQFLYFLIGSPLALDQILSKVNSGAQGNVGKSDFEKLKITLPPLKEQHKISLILSSVDEKMNVLNDKKSHYQELKKGLMQQLLTGKIRVSI